MEPTNGASPGVNDARPRKRQRQTGEAVENLNIHPDLQAAAGIPMPNNLQSLRQNLESEHGDYPRRRAVIACEVCRGRKTRCDGGKPKCRLCTDLGAECVYREPGQKLDAGDKLILDQLHRIEGLLHHFGEAGPLLGQVQDRPRNVPQQRNRPAQPATDLFDAVANGPMTADLLSQPFSQNTPVSAELSRIDFPAATNVSLDHSAIASRIESYFHRMHEIHALINPSTWQAVYATASLSNFGRSIEGCTVLLLAALGSCASERRLLVTSSSEDAPGAAYFAKAWSMLPEILLSNSIAAIQCLVLGAIYLLEVYRPLDAWNVSNLAASKLDLHLSAFPDPFGPEVEQIKRIYWNLRLLRWNLVSVLDLPSTSDEAPQAATAVGMPSSFPLNAKLEAEGDDPSHLVAQIGLQQLAERASRALPTTTSGSANMDVLLPVAASFDDQLNQWYDRLPESMKFPQEGYPSSSAAQNILRHGFFACRAAMFRPFVFAIVHNPDAADNDRITLWCKKCLEASVRQIEYTSALHAEQLGWKRANDIVAEALFILAATLTPALAAMLPPAEDLKTRLIDHVVAEIDKLGGPGSPALAVKVAVLRAAEEKRQGLLYSRG